MDDWRDLADTVAERAVAIGHPAIDVSRSLEKQLWMVRSEL